MALQAGCQQQPAPGVLLGLSGTIFSDQRVAIIEPGIPKDDSSSDPALATPAIVGIAAGALVLTLIVAGASFVCFRKRKNRRARASAQADFYSSFGHRHTSSVPSFQCKTHMVSPRFWPGAEEGPPTPADEMGDLQPRRSSIWKPQESPYQQDGNAFYGAKKAAMTPLHPITTSVGPAPPPQAYTSPSTIIGGVHSPSDSRSPLSAESARSTSALLPSIRPYVPAEHGVHVHGTPPPVSASTFGGPTPGAGTGTTPLLRSHGWPLEQPPAQQQQPQPQQAHKPQKHIIESGNPVPPPPPPQTSRISGIRGAKNGAKNAGTGSPVDSWEIQTAFAAPPKR